VRQYAPDGTRWLVAWRELGPVIEIGYVGPAPSTPGGREDAIIAGR
jgi:hypothetical protein